MILTASGGPSDANTAADAEAMATAAAAAVEDLPASALHPLLHSFLLVREPLA